MIVHCEFARMRRWEFRYERSKESNERTPPSDRQCRTAAASPPLKAITGLRDDSVTTPAASILPASPDFDFLPIRASATLKGGGGLANSPIRRIRRIGVANWRIASFLRLTGQFPRLCGVPPPEVANSSTTGKVANRFQHALKSSMKRLLLINASVRTAPEMV